jgi:cyclic AMP-dependent transcription factor ATF-6 beta
VLESLPFPSLHSGKAPATRKPPLQPKPVVLTTVPVPPRAGPTSAAVLLQPLVQQPAGEEAREGPGSELTAPEGPGPSGLVCEIGHGVLTSPSRTSSCSSF